MRQTFVANQHCDVHQRRASDIEPFDVKQKLAPEQMAAAFQVAPIAVSSSAASEEQELEILKTLSVSQILKVMSGEDLASVAE
jgi:hypothetical protein